MGKGIAGVRVGSSSPPSIPTTGMRGGLGRTLLTAFLILTILPLTLIGGYAAYQNRRNVQREVASKLKAVATLKGEELLQWFGNLQTLLQLSVSLEDDRAGANRDQWWQVLRRQIPELTGVIVTGVDEQPVWSAGACQLPSMTAGSHDFTITSRKTSVGDSISTPVRFSIPYPNVVVSLVVQNNQNQTYTFCLDSEALERVIRYDGPSEETGQVYLVYDSCLWAEGEFCSSSAIEALVETGSGSGAYVNHLGIAVTGAYYALTDPGIGVLVEQAQAETLESTDWIAATIIAFVLAVALVTTAIAAVVIRQITRPVIQLTESAVAMAEGDLDQHLSVKSRDEIGILTYVFNEMAAELKSLYEDLEAKVAERTQKLQRANYQIQRRALHLQASQEVGQAITSMRDPALLLRRVTELIRDRFVYASVALYILEPGGGEARLRAMSPETDTEAEQGVWSKQIHAGEGSVVECAIRKRVTQIESQQTTEEIEWHRRTLSRVAVPLSMGERVIGALAVLSTEREGIQEDEVEVLELLATQVSIALENARAYERERLAAKQLEEAEAFKSRFLMNMSHEFREPLNSIIGFSRLMIKGVDGALTEQQTQDLDQIYNDGQRLLFLINDILAISQIQAGLMELKFQPVDLMELVAGVMPTASALVRGKDVQLVQDLSEDLPLLWADPTRLRQVLIHLLSNAAKFTEKGEIALRAWRNEDQVYVSVSDTGIGIPPEDCERIFVRFEKGSAGERRHAPGAGLGLALSKEFVEMHGGQIWVNSKLNAGSTFTFSVPCYLEASKSAE